MEFFAHLSQCIPLPTFLLKAYALYAGSHALKPYPQRLHPRLAVTFSPHEAAKPGNHVQRLAQRRRLVGHLLACHYPRCLPFFTHEQPFGIPLRTAAPQSHQQADAPGHHQVDGQRPLDALHAPQLQRLNPATLFEREKQQLDFPACPVPVDQLRRIFQRVLSSTPLRVPSLRLGSRAHIHASSTPSGTRAGLTA